MYECLNATCSLKIVKLADIFYNFYVFFFFLLSKAMYGVSRSLDRGVAGLSLPIKHHPCTHTGKLSKQTIFKDVRCQTKTGSPTHTASFGESDQVTPD